MLTQPGAFHLKEQPLLSIIGVLFQRIISTRLPYLITPSCHMGLSGAPEMEKQET